MTLNGIMAVILSHFTQFGSSGANYVSEVEGRHKMSAKNVAQKSTLPQHLIYGDTL